MNSLYLFTYLYSRLVDNSLLPNRIMSAVRYATRSFANFILSHDLSGIKPKVREYAPNVIVSLTSFPARINVVWKVIKTLKCQEVRPDRIILWLSKDQFQNEKSIPSNLKRLEDDLFEIRLVDGDIRSHKKYFYALQEFSESYVVTVDDDIYYNPKTLTYLMTVSKQFPKSIVANISIKIKYDGENLLSTRKWKGHVAAYEDKNLVQIGAGGVLYPPHCLDPIVFNEDVLKKVAPNADDLWLNVTSRLAKTKIVQTPSNIVFLPVKIKAPSLCKTNVNQGGNDQQLENIRRFFLETRGFDPYSVDYTF